MTVRLGPLNRDHRSQLETIVRATGVFSDEEVGVALELFDEGIIGKMENGEWKMGSERESPTGPSSILDSPFSPPDYEFLGAFDGDRLIGYACFGATPATDRTYDLYWIAVHPEAQRSGAGTVLMTEVEGRLSARRARLLVIDTSSRDDYAPTRKFYHRRGYEEAARIRDFYAPGDDRIVLGKRLTASAGRRNPPPTPAQGL